MSASIIRLRGLLAVLLLIGLFCLLPARSAAQTAWEKTAGPPGTNVPVIYKTNGIIYAGTDTLGVYRSTDNGQNWTAANGGIERTRVYDIIASGPNLLAATTASNCPNSVNIFRSTDNGDTWTPTNGLQGFSAQSFALKGNFVYAGVFTIQGEGIWRSADNGNTWQPVPSPIDKGDKLFVSDNALIVANDNFIWRTLDDGATWDLVEQFALSGILDFARAGTKLFAAGVGVLFTSDDNGANWAFTPFNGGVASLAGVGDIVFLGSGNKVYRSTNFGATWEDVSTGLGKGSIQEMWFDGTDLFASTPADAAGIYHSANLGDNWTAAAAGLPVASAIRSLVSFESYVYAGTDGDGVYRSSDQGRTWAKTGTGDPQVAQAQVIDMFANANTLFLATGYGIYRSTDGGVTFQQIHNGFPANIRILALSLTESSGNLLAAVSVLITPSEALEGIFYSSDNGDSWHQANIPASVTSVSAVESDGSSLAYAGVYTQTSSTTGLYKSSDGGLTWSFRPQFMVDIQTMAVKNNNVVASSLFSAWYSTDFGEGWTPSSLPGSPRHGAADTYTLKDNAVYAGDEGMYLSTNSGATWTPIREGFPTCPWPIVQASTTDDSYLYAGTAGEGVWRKFLGGPTPSPTQKPSETPTNTPTNTPTATATSTPTADPTPTPSSPGSPTLTPTPTATATATNTPTATATATATNTPITTPTTAVTPTATQTIQFTPTQTATITPTPQFSPTPSPTSTPLLRFRADFDGDGRTDVSVYRPSEGNWYYQGSTSGFHAAHFGASTDIPAPGDFDGDGRTDISVFRPSNGVWYRLDSSTGTFSFVEWGLNGDIPQAGDHDGDGRSDQAVFRPSNGTWYWIRSSDGQLAGMQFGQNGDKPVAGYYDGDDRQDLAVFRGGIWYKFDSSNGQFSAESFGIDTDIPSPADYDGDYRDDIAVFRPSNGNWYFHFSGSGQYGGMHWGQNGDVPVPGEYDGDGRDDIAIYRDGIWFMNASTDGPSAMAFGLSTDIPIPKMYIP